MYSSVDRHLGYFYLFLAIMSNTAMNSHVYVFCMFLILMGIYPGIAGPRGYSVSLFWETARPLSKGAASRFVPTSNVYEFQFLHLLTNSYCSYFLLSLFFNTKGSIPHAVLRTLLLLHDISEILPFQENRQRGAVSGKAAGTEEAGRRGIPNEHTYIWVIFLLQLSRITNTHAHTHIHTYTCPWKGPRASSENHLSGSPLTWQREPKIWKDLVNFLGSLDC